MNEPPIQTPALPGGILLSTPTAPYFLPTLLPEMQSTPGFNQPPTTPIATNIGPPLTLPIPKKFNCNSKVRLNTKGEQIMETETTPESDIGPLAIAICGQLGSFVNDVGQCGPYLAPYGSI